jgi:hypothetical protein
MQKFSAEISPPTIPELLKEKDDPMKLDPNKETSAPNLVFPRTERVELRETSAMREHDPEK